MTILPSPSDVEAILNELGFRDLDSFMESVLGGFISKIPEEELPSMDQPSLLRYMEGLATRNRVYRPEKVYAGWGVEPAYVSPVAKYLVSRGEFLTSYTPYQPEMSQGMLQALYEYQSVMAELLGLEVVNSSMYDGASALADISITCRGDLPLWSRFGDGEVCRPCHGWWVTGADLVHSYGALFIVYTDLWSTPVVAPPGDIGADVAVAEGQPMGLYMGAGGPLLGVLAVRGEHRLIRNMPGRLIGETRTVQVLINILIMGRSGLVRKSIEMMELAHRLADRLEGYGGIHPSRSPFHRRFTIGFGDVDTHKLYSRLVEMGYLPGNISSHGLSMNINFFHSDEAIEEFASSVEVVLEDVQAG